MAINPHQAMFLRTGSGVRQRAAWRHRQRRVTEMAIDCKWEFFYIANHLGAIDIDPLYLDRSGVHEHEDTWWKKECVEHTAQQRPFGRAIDRPEVRGRADFDTRASLPQVEKSVPVRQELRPTVHGVALLVIGLRHLRRDASSSRHPAQPAAGIREEDRSLGIPCRAACLERRVAQGHGHRPIGADSLQLGVSEEADVLSVR